MERWYDLKLYVAQAVVTIARTAVYSNVSGKRRVASREGANTADRYEIDIRGGASTLEIR